MIDAEETIERRETTTRKLCEETLQSHQMIRLFFYSLWSEDRVSVSFGPTLGPSYLQPIIQVRLRITKPVISLKAK